MRQTHERSPGEEGNAVHQRRDNPPDPECMAFMSIMLADGCIIAATIALNGFEIVAASIGALHPAVFAAALFFVIAPNAGIYLTDKRGILTAVVSVAVYGALMAAFASLPDPPHINVPILAAVISIVGVQSVAIMMMKPAGGSD